MLDGPEVRYRRTKRHTRLRVLDARGEHLLGAARGPGPELQSPHVQNVKGDNVPAPDFSEHVFHRYRDVIEVQSRRGAALNAHLFLFGAALDAEGTLHQEGGEFL